MAGDGIGHAAKCFRYGSFMRDLRRWQVELIFFGCFGFVILELIIAGLAWVHSEAIVKQIREAEKEVERGCVREDLDHRKHVLRKRQYKTVAITSVCALLGVVATVMEAFAILAHEYCDGEDLTQFYWAFWSLISVGACIALIGLSIYHIYSLNDKDHPPWMIALGTPVLVLAGLGHLLVLAILVLLRKFLGWPEIRPQELARRRSSPASTIPLRGNAYGAYVLGFNASGEPLIRFPNNANRPAPPVGSELLHFDPVTGAATVRYPSLRIIQDPENLGAAQYTMPESLVAKQEESVQEQLDSLSSSSSGVVSQIPNRGS